MKNWISPFQRRNTECCCRKIVKKVKTTSTPGSMLMEVICFTISEGLWRSMTLLWILIWNLSQVLEPSPGSRKYTLCYFKLER